MHSCPAQRVDNSDLCPHVVDGVLPQELLPRDYQLLRLRLGPAPVGQQAHNDTCAPHAQTAVFRVSLVPGAQRGCGVEQRAQTIAQTIGNERGAPVASGSPIGLCVTPAPASHRAPCTVSLPCPTHRVPRTSLASRPTPPLCSSAQMPSNRRTDNDGESADADGHQPLPPIERIRLEGATADLCSFDSETGLVSTACRCIRWSAREIVVVPGR